MTPDQHNKLLGIAHLVYGGLFALVIVGMLVLFSFVMGMAGSADSPDGPPAVFFLLMWLFIAFFYTLMMIPSFIAGYALLKRKRWAKIVSIIAGVISGMSFPIGTAVCIYTFWFLFSEPGRVLYDRPSYSLPPPPPNWAAKDAGNRSEHRFSPGTQPPDWR